jgi:site-specific recombinase XerD
MFVAKVPRSKFFQVVYFVNGKRKTLSTRTTNQREAWKFLESFQNSLANPISEIENPLPKKNLPTLSEFKKEYVEYMTPTKSKHYIESIVTSFKIFINSSGDIKLDGVDRRAIDLFITNTFARTPRGAHQYYRTLKAAFNKAIEWNYIVTNPFAKVKFPKLPKSFPLFITEVELQIILENTPHEYLKDIFITGFYTGLRLGELINMRWNWIDLAQNHITVKCTEQFITKSKKERIVPICETVNSILLRRYNDGASRQNDVVFWRILNRKLHQETISKQFKAIVLKCRLNNHIHFHSLRHSFASLLVQKGVSLYVVKELLGHEDLATTQIYSHLRHSNLREAINLI